jgi:dephospho-CoA kinase
MNNALKVGITGGIGSGKSLVCRIFSCLQVPVYNADERAKLIMNHDDTLKSEIVALFGPEAYENGKLNRSHLSKIAFHQPQILEKLNALVHPKVGQDFRHWLVEQDSAMVIKEAALFFETGSYREMNYMITVSAPDPIKLARVKRRDPHRTEANIKAIMEKQLSDQEKTSQSDYVIMNNEKVLLIPQVLSIYKELSRSAGS